MNGKAAFAIAAVVPEFPELLDTFFESGGIALRAETEGHRFDGTRLTLELQLSPLESPEGKGVAIVVSDVTKHRKLELMHEEQKVQAERVQETFSRYLAPHVVKSLMSDPGSIRLGGERKRATMFFADVRGFTSLAGDAARRTRRRNSQHAISKKRSASYLKTTAYSISFMATD